MVDATLIKTLTKRDGKRATLVILRDWAMIGTAIGLALWADHWAVTLLALWVIGAGQYALGDALMHEAAHGNLFATKPLNDRMELVYGLPFLQTMERYKTEHLRHHGQLGKEGDYLTGEYRAFGLDRAPNMLWVWVLRPLLGWPAWHYLAKLAKMPKQSAIRLAALWGAALAVAAVSRCFGAFLLYWVLPLLWCRYAFLYWSEIADHAHTVAGTRTRVNRLTNWFQHNKGYHAAHHRFPAVPWFNLPEAHGQLDHVAPADLSHNPWETWTQLRSTPVDLAVEAGG
jgi:fatty acid desaturase